ncbi:MAG: hypothetical protein IT578_08635 [Verrucomicrobiae bacterium]|nr:hypothetical protein [Verrucomicrobiae bacterium]
MKPMFQAYTERCLQPQPRLRKVNGILAVAIWVAGIGTLALLSRPPMPGLFYVPFVMWPHAITHFAILNAKDTKGQSCLLGAQIVYGVWVAAACAAMFRAPANAAAMELLVEAFRAVPVLGALWLAALLCHLHKRRLVRRAALQAAR